MVRFGNLTPSSIDGYEARLHRGDPLTDQMLLDGLRGAQPPLGTNLMQPLSAELDPKLRRKVGRPRRNILPRMELAKALRDAALPPLFHNALVLRLTQGRRYTERERAFQCHHQMEKPKQRHVFPALYREFRELYRRGETIDHPIFGRIETGHVAGEPRHRAVAILTQQIARERLYLNRPSAGTIINIVRKSS